MGDGKLAGLWRGTVDVTAGPDGIRRQIAAAVPELLERSGLLKALRKRKYYEKPCELRRRAKLRKLSNIRKGPTRTDARR